MPTKVYWYLQNRIVVNEHYGAVTPDILQRAVAATLQLAQSSKTPFHLIIDAEKLQYTPSHLGDLGQIARGLLKNKRFESVMIVTTNPLHQFIGSAVFQLLRKSSKVVSNRDEALRALQELDASLPNLLEIQPDNSDAVLID